MFPFAASLLAVVAAPGTPPTSRVPPAQGTPLPDIKAILPPEPYYIAASQWWWLLVGAVAVFAAFLLWQFVLRHLFKPKPGLVVSPRERAERRLRELEARMGGVDPRAFGNEVADVLRVYIGEQFGLHPERQTSPEFLGSITGARVFTKSEHILLADFLEGCDLLKFARADAGLERKRSLIAQAGDFVASSAPPPLPEVGSRKSEVGRQKEAVSPSI